MPLRLIAHISTPNRAHAAAFEIGCKRFKLAVAPGRQIVFILLGLLLYRGEVGVRHLSFISRLHKHSLEKLLTAAALMIRRVGELLLRAQLQVRTGRLIAVLVAAEELSLGRPVTAIANFALL